MSLQPLRIAVIGAGLIGRRHIQTIVQRPDLAELAGVADPVQRAADCPELQVPFSTDAAERLDQAKPEAVVIASPDNLHLPHALLCCERGLHFLVERPVAATPAIVQASEQEAGVEPRGM